MGNIVLLGGGTGLVGSQLQVFLRNEGYEVRLLVRDRKKADGVSKFHWDPLKDEIDENAFHGIDYIINLSGASVGSKRWTASYKKEIRDSRVKSNALLVEGIKRNQVPLKKFISSSAVGYYVSSDIPFDEEGTKGTAFLSKVCEDWENAAKPLRDLHIPVAFVRTGIVFAPEGGFVKEMLPLFRLGLGSVLGNGKQLISWIHITDLCRVFIYLLKNEGTGGAYNAVSIKPASNREISQHIARILKRPLWLPPVPAFVLKALFGDFSYELLVSHNVVPKRLLEEGFSFKYPQTEEALRSCIEDKK